MAKRIYDIPSQSVDESLFTPKGQSAPSGNSVPSDTPPPAPGTSVPGAGSPQASPSFPEWAQTGAAPSASAATVPASPLPTIPPPSGSIKSSDTSGVSAPSAPPAPPAPAAHVEPTAAPQAATPPADAAAEGGRRARRMASEPVTSIDSLDELFRQAAAGAMSQTSAATSAAGASLPVPEAAAPESPAPAAAAPAADAAPAPSPTAAEVPYFTEDAASAPADAPTHIMDEVPADAPTLAFPSQPAADGGLLDLPDIAPAAEGELNFPPPGVDEGLLSFTSGFGAGDPKPNRESQLLSVPEIVEEEREARPEMELTAREGSNPELLDALKEVVYTGASDLHIASGAVPMIRIDGGLQPLKGVAVWDKDRTRDALFSILDQKQEEQFLEALELDFAFELSEAARFRVNFYMDRGNLGAAFRIIPTEIKQLKDLGIQESVSQFATLPRGLVLVTGPTGSGKSTVGRAHRPGQPHPC